MVASGAGDEFSDYHLEAAIAGCHALAPSFEATDWKKILDLYEVLSAIKSDPIVEMNKAIVLGLAESPQKGLEKLKSIKGLEQNYIYLTALGDFYQQLHNSTQARHYYELAIQKTKSKSEIELLQSKITSLV
jgi:predicted RNA polymerase sigma factor